MSITGGEVTWKPKLFREYEGLAIRGLVEGLALEARQMEAWLFTKLVQFWFYLIKLWVELLITRKICKTVFMEGDTLYVWVDGKHPHTQGIPFNPDSLTLFS